MNLWRYLDVAKFVALLQTKAIHFPRGDQFEDPFEGSYPLRSIDTFEDNDVYSAEEWKKFVAISCWYKSDIESDAMWRLYSSHKQGIAIKTTWDKLNAAVQEHAHLISVEYIDFVKDEANIFIPSDVFKYKRKAYIHENEVRAIITKYPKTDIINGMPSNSEPIKNQEITKNGILIEVELTNLIKQVVVTPLCDSWFLEVVIKLCKIYGLPADIVVKSELSADPVYAKI